MDLVPVLVSLLSGAVGGNVAGAAAPDKSLGTIGNSISGLLGGGLGSYLLQILGLLGQAAVTTPAAPDGGIDIASLLANIGGSGIGGAILTLIIGWLKNATQK